MPLTIDELRELLAASNTHASDNDSPWVIGTAYLIRTATNYITGRLARIYAGELVLDEAAWIADTGRFHDALKSGVCNEVEPYLHAVIVSRGAIVDATEWEGRLPTEQK